MKKLPIVILTLLALPLSAKEINTQALKACSFVENDFQRLQCYDQVIAGKELTATEKNKSSKSQAKLPDNAAAPAKSKSENVAATAQKAEDNFGLEHRKVEKKDDEITSVVTKVKTHPHGELIITLENGHVWQQIGSDRFNLQAGETVIITRGMFNSFIMKVEGRNRGIKVKRK